MVKQRRKPHRFKKRKPIYRNRFFWLGLLILIFLLSTFYFLFFSKTFQVKEIIAGLQQVSDQQLNTSLRSVIEGKLETKILFFPTRSIFLVNLNKIKEDILKKFPQIARVEIRRNFPNSLNILITERKIIATFCKEFEEDKSSSLPFAVAREVNCFALDKEGIAFEEKLVDYTLQPLIKTLIFVDKINLGKKVIEKEDLISILEINSQLEENLNILIKGFIISSREKLIVLTQEGWELYF
ncbi:MAG: FtsQ-type POTRA domain-containing protein, partial [bacterium]|nr:FtsQ-type POTRA domain-containing protein [bacterium]